MKLPRRRFLHLAAGAAALPVMSRIARAQAYSTRPEPSAVTPALIKAARKEGKLAWYDGALDLDKAEKFGRAFEAKYPGISVRVERSGSERIYQRVGQEKQSGIHAVDVVNSADAAHFLEWKKNGWLAPYVPEDVAAHFPPSYVDADGTYAILCAWLTTIGYNTRLVKREDAPKGFVDLLDPKWKGKIVKAHPGFSGTILTTTFILVRELGWSYFEKLGQQKVLQVQSASDGPKKLILGERAVNADGSDYQFVLPKEQGKSIEIVYPIEGSPLIPVPSAVFQNAPNPNAARLFQSFLFSGEAEKIGPATIALFEAIMKTWWGCSKLFSGRGQARQRYPRHHLRLDQVDPAQRARSRLRQTEHAGRIPDPARQHPRAWLLPLSNSRMIACPPRGPQTAAREEKLRVKRKQRNDTCFHIPHTTG